MAKGTARSLSKVTTPGMFTSEFYGMVAVIVAALVLGLAGKIDGAVAMGAITTAVSAYTLSRGIAKKGNDATTGRGQ